MYWTWSCRTDPLWVLCTRMNTEKKGLWQIWMASEPDQSHVNKFHCEWKTYGHIILGCKCSLFYRVDLFILHGLSDCKDVFITVGLRIWASTTPFQSYWFILTLVFWKICFFKGINYIVNNIVRSRVTTTFKCDGIYLLCVSCTSSHSLWLWVSCSLHSALFSLS